MLYRDKKLFNQKITRAGDYYLERLPARLGNYSQTVAISDKPGYVYARLETSGQVVEALNTGTAPAVFDLPVFIGRDKSQPAIVKVLEVRWLYAAGAILSFIAYHHQQHEYPNPDTVWVRRDQFLPLLVLPAGGFHVRLYGDTIYSFGMTNPIRVENQEDIDLSSYAVAEGAKYVLLEVQPDGTLNYIEGDLAASREILELGSLPTPSANAFPVCAFEFYDSQTELRRDSTERTIIDLRMFTSDTSSGIGDQIHAAAAETTVADGDEWGFWDISTSLLKKITWANIKATLKTYFDGIYSTVAAFVDLSDVPNDYTGLAGQYLRVKATEDGLEAATPSGTGDMAKAVYDTDDDGAVDLAEDLDIASMTEELSPTSGDKLVIDRAGTRKKVDLDNLPGGTGSVSWTKVVDESGASFTNFTGSGGTWSSDGTVIKQTNTAAAAAYAKFNTMLVDGLIIFEAEIQIRSSGTDRIGGLIVGFDGTSAGGLGVRLNEGADQIQCEIVFTTNKLAISQTININTWYKLRLVVGGGRVTVYLDGTLKGSSNINPTILNASYIGMYTYQAEVWFRNIKAWNLSLPA